MLQARYLLLSNSGKVKIYGDQRRGVKLSLVAGLKGKVPRRSCTVRVGLFIRF